ncbi:MAG: DUF5069 domain-containing protein [Chloroflexota bacterium]
MATNTMVPLISSDVAGPLGAIHLPRLWQKVLLSAKGMLPADYDECGKGFDQMTLDGLGLDREQTLSYLRTSLPTYPQFEQWVRGQKGGSIDAPTIERHNAAIRGYIHPDATRQEILTTAGMPDDGSIKDAVTLNKLEDYAEFHANLTKA